MTKTYTPHGNIETEETGDRRTTKKFYDAENLYVIGEIANGKRSQRINEPVTGTPLELIAHSGATVRMTYDAFGRITVFMSADDTLDNPTRAISYDDSSLPNAMHLSYRIDTSTRAYTATYYDGMSKEVQKRVERQPGEVVVSSWMNQNPWHQTIAEFEPTLADTLAFSVWNHRTAVVETGAGGAAITTHYSIGLFGELLELSDDNGTICNYTYDLRGNRLTLNHRDAGRPDLLTDITRPGEPAFNVNYDGNGNLTSLPGRILTFNFKNQLMILRTFAMHDYDDEIGLIYMGYRWYAPETGQFITPDQFYLYRPERSDGDPVQLRLYTYVGNSPLDNVDPTGLSFWSVFGAIVGVIVGIVVAVAVVAAFATGIGWGLLAIAGVIALITVSYVVAHNNQGTALGEFFRGFMIGLNAGMNAAFLTMMGPVGAFLGGFVGILIFLSAFDTIAGNEIYQGILGWSNWLMPMSWLVIGLGAIMWILNGLGHLIFWEIPNLWGGGIEFFRITGFRMDWSTGMLATRGGWAANANIIDTAYNMGFFAYVDNNSTGWHLDHEAGHNLNLAVFGSIFHFVGFIHEMGAGAGSTAFSEVLADSNDGDPGMWMA